MLNTACNAQAYNSCAVLSDGSTILRRLQRPLKTSLYGRTNNALRDDQAEDSVHRSSRAHDVNGTADLRGVGPYLACGRKCTKHLQPKLYVTRLYQSHVVSRKNHQLHSHINCAAHCLRLLDKVTSRFWPTEQWVDTQTHGRGEWRCCTRFSSL